MDWLERVLIENNSPARPCYLTGSYPNTSFRDNIWTQTTDVTFQLSSLSLVCTQLDFRQECPSTSTCMDITAGKDTNNSAQICVLCHTRALIEPPCHSSACVGCILHISCFRVSQFLPASIYGQQSCTELPCYVMVKHGGCAPAKWTSMWRRKHAQWAPRQQHQDQKKIPRETAMREDGARKLAEGDHRVISLVIVREVSCYVAAHSEIQALSCEIKEIDFQ